MIRTALIAGSGALAPLLAEALDEPVVYALEGVAVDLPAQPFRLERLALLIDALIRQGVERVVFAGAVRRPPLDPEAFDPRTATLVPRILAAMQQGDDAALRELIAIFEESGLQVVGADSILPDLVPQAGVLAGNPDDAARADCDRARAILQTTGALDIGQGCVVARGLCVAIETLPGTQAMLEFAAQHRIPASAPRGVFYKAPKPGQDRRIDLPAIGPDTVTQAAAAGLAGIAWEAGGVLVLDRAATIAAAEAAGLFLWARD